MSGGLLAVMIGVSLLLGAIALIALLWALKSGQFEDYHKFLDGARDDDEEALNDAARLERRRKEAKKDRS